MTILDSKVDVGSRRLQERYVEFGEVHGRFWVIEVTGRGP